MPLSSTIITSSSISHLIKNQPPTPKEGEELEELTNECRELLRSCPKEKGWRTTHLYKFQGFWCQAKEIQSILSFQRHFQAKNDDVIIATIPKSGTTWLKAITFAIINRQKFELSSKSHPLLTSNSHDLVPFFEYKLYANNQIPDFSKIPSPRLFATHVPYLSLQESIKNTNCKIIYICRNPFDTFISSWMYSNKLVSSETRPSLSLDEYFTMYCKGVVGFGPFWDHMLGYWKESKERADKVLFLKYEDMKEDIAENLKKIAEFVGCPFSKEEERQGVVEQVAELCSFGNLKGLDVNKSGKSILNCENRHLFRKGEVGDWVNYLSPAMAEKLSLVVDDKLGGSGLQFKVLLNKS